MLTLIASGTALAVLGYASHSLRLTGRSLEFQRARAAAEAGLDYGVRQLQDTLSTNRLNLDQTTLQNILDAIAPPPAISNYLYQTPDGATAFRITADTSVLTGTIAEGDIARTLTGRRQEFTVTCGVRHATDGVAAVVKKHLQGLSLPLQRFGIFYHEDLEFDPVSSLAWNGRLHANGNLYLDGPLDLGERVSAFGDILHARKDTGATAGSVYIKNSVNQLVSMTQSLQPMDSRHDNWMSQALILWDGRVLDRAHAVPYVGPPGRYRGSHHDLIERPLSTSHPDYDAQTEAAKFVHQAALKLHVSATGVFTATDYFGADVTSRFSPAVAKTEMVTAEDGVAYAFCKRKAHGEYEFNTVGSYDVFQQFHDHRESADVAPLDIYVAELLAAFPELVSGTYSADEGCGVIYVTRDDPDGAGGLLPAVRLRNGRKLPASGLTIVSDLPIYIDGDYNEETSPPEPALVASDAITVLSRDWQDVRSTWAVSDRVADHTECNALLLTGNHPTVPAGPYNGGVENIVRLLEDWSGKDLMITGAFHVWWQSEVGTGPWNSAVYHAPSLVWTYDTQHLTGGPPSAPELFAVEQLGWSESTWAAEGW